MVKRNSVLRITRMFLCLAVFLPLVARSDQALSAARDAILKATQHALSALLSHNDSEYVAVLHPDFIQFNHAGKPIRRTAEGQQHWGFVTPQLFVTDDQRTEQMQLIEATSAITSISMPSADEAVVTGEEVLRWQGKHGED
ncbi:MAG: hypothetical protein ACRD2L_26305, partial [Terriglobia bacterium]